MANEDGKGTQEDTMTLAEVEVRATDPAEESEAEETVDSDFSPSSAAETTDDEGANKELVPVGRESTTSVAPLTDTAVLDELKEADEKAYFTLMMIAAMRKSIDLFRDKESMSEEDAGVLEEKQLQLMQKLKEFEEITKRVQDLVGLTGMNGRFQPTFLRLLEGAVGEPDLRLGDPSEKSVVASPAMEDLAMEDPAMEDRAMETGEGSTPCEAAHTTDEEPASEDRLPKVVVCGLEENVPRIVVCESPKRPEQRKRPGTMHKDGLMKSLTGRLSQCYCIQEKLATENADLEGVRSCTKTKQKNMAKNPNPNCSCEPVEPKENPGYSLQEELLLKENTIECMQNKICTLQNEMRLVMKENSVLCTTLAKKNQEQHHPSKQDPCPTKCPPQCIANKPGFGQKPPKEDRTALEKYCQNTTCLEKQLDGIEHEVRRMQNELCKVQKDREVLETQKKLLKCTGPECLKRAMAPCNPCPPTNVLMSPRDNSASEQALRELKEQYARLQDDFKGKVTEVAGLRREIDKYKELAEKAREAQEAAEGDARSANERRNTLERETSKMLGSKEQLMEQEQQLAVAKQRFRESQDELEELRALIQDQASQLEDYRNKYLQAQQQVEEQRRQIEMMELDNSRISEQVALEIQRVKNQFQERLQELTPLPEILKATQMKLQESQQLRAIAERNCEDLARECQEAKDKAANYARQLDDSMTSSNLDLEEKGNMKSRLEKWEAKFNELKDENAELKTTIARMEEAASQAQIRLEEKLHELAQLSAQLDTLREESARQVSRTKERAETVRRSLQNQISELERQLAQSRAAARTAQKDRDDIRQRMQGQINSLNESFDQAQMRIRSLQGHVNFLKTSYSNIFNADNQNPLMIADGNPNPPCDCDQFH